MMEFFSLLKKGNHKQKKKLFKGENKKKVSEIFPSLFRNSISAESMRRGRKRPVVYEDCSLFPDFHVNKDSVTTSGFSGCYYCRP